MDKRSWPEELRQEGDPRGSTGGKADRQGAESRGAKGTNTSLRLDTIRRIRGAGSVHELKVMRGSSHACAHSPGRAASCTSTRGRGLLARQPAAQPVPLHTPPPARAPHRVSSAPSNATHILANTTTPIPYATAQGHAIVTAERAPPPQHTVHTTTGTETAPCGTRARHQHPPASHGLTRLRCSPRTAAALALRRLAHGARPSDRPADSRNRLSSLSPSNREAYGLEKRHHGGRGGLLRVLRR